MVSRGADDFDSVMRYAIKNNNRELIEYLIPLIDSAWYGDLDLVKIFVALGGRNYNMAILSALKKII